MIQSLPPRYQVEAKPTWELAWGLFWRMILIQLFGFVILGTAYGIFLLLIGVY